MHKFILFFVITVTLFACSKQVPLNDFEINQFPSKYSSVGHEAYIVEFLGENGNTQVLVNYSSKECGAGAAWATGVNLGLEINWQNKNTLTIKKPKGLTLSLNPSGKVLQYNKQYVYVEIVDA